MLHSIVIKLRCPKLSRGTSVSKLLVTAVVVQVHFTTPVEFLLPHYFQKFKPISVLKKVRCNKDITPFHTAAVNPNVAYLRALMAVESNFNVPDSDNWFVLFRKFLIFTLLWG